MPKIDTNHPLAVNAAIVDLSTGEDMPNVIEADEEAGTIRRYRVDATGQIVVGRSVPEVETITGLKIRIDVTVDGVRKPLAEYERRPEAVAPLERKPSGKLGAGKGQAEDPPK